MNKKGIALILSFAVIMILAILGSVVISRSVNESRIAQRYAQSTQAFWLAEAGVNRALRELKAQADAGNFDTYAGSLSEDVGIGKYEVTVSNGVDLEHKKVTARGFIPSTSATPSAEIEAIIYSGIPANFYDNAVYSAGTVDFNGNSFIVRNDTPETNPCSDPLNPPPCNDTVLYAGDFEVQQPANIIGAPSVQDDSISPLALLDYEQLHDISALQGNVYIKSGSKIINEATGLEGFPTDFWYTTDDDGVDNDGDSVTDEADEDVPNVVYVETDLTLKGSIGTIGGFYVVVGDVITNPSGTYDATINGNGQIDGVIYTRGTFSINGGGGGLNVLGGVWAGEEVELNGNANITYNAEYMNKIRNLDIEPSPQITSWRDTQKPYKVE